MKLEEMKKVSNERTKGEWHVPHSLESTISLETDDEFICDLFEIGYAVSPIKAKGNAEFIAMCANNWDKLIVVVEAAKNVMEKYSLTNGWATASEPSIPIAFSPLAKAIQELERE